MIVHFIHEATNKYSKFLQEEEMLRGGLYCSKPGMTATTPVECRYLFAATAGRRYLLLQPISCRQQLLPRCPTIKGSGRPQILTLELRLMHSTPIPKLIIGPIKLTDLDGHKCRWHDGTCPRPPKHRTARLCPSRAITGRGSCELVDGRGHWESSNGQR